MIGFALAVLMGAGLVAILATVRPNWSARKRQILSASVLPGITAVATALGATFIASSDHGQSEHMEDLAIAAVVTIGGGFTLLALVGGVIGALLAGKRRR